MKVLIIGSHGFIGGYVCHRFVKSGWEVIGIDNINMYKPEQYQLFLRHYDLRQKNQLNEVKVFYRMDCVHATEVSRIVRRHQPDIIINVGGLSVADVCKHNTEEAVQSIYKLNDNILEAIKEDAKLERYVYISSSMVYGDFPSERVDEDAPKRPKDPYGAIKLGAELLIQSFQQQFGVPYSIIRPSAVYGPLDSNMRVTGNFMLNAHQGKPLKVKDVSEKLDFTYVEDAAEGIFLVATHPAAVNQVFNITRGEGRTILELAEQIQKHYPNVKILKDAKAEYQEGLIRPKRGALNIDKARRLLGYAPKYSLEEGINKYVQEWKKIWP